MKKDLLRKSLAFILALAIIIALSSTAYANSTALKKGDNSQEVVNLQKMLKKLGYFDADCTGYFGDITEKAVMAFQKDYKLEVDGIAGKATLTKLTDLTSSTGSRSSTAQKNDSVIHTVKQGDTVWDIAKSYGVSTASILEVNNLTEKSFLQIGNKLIIPGIKKTTSAANSSNDTSSNDNSSNTDNKYTVKEGDCASSIAEDFGVSLAALLKVNNLTESSILKVGQALLIPTDEQDAQYSNVSTGETSNTNKNTSTEGTNNTSNNSTKGEYLDWLKEVQYIFERGMTAVVTDVDTGRSFNIKRYQGHNHADVEPLTAEDTAIMKSIYGSWSWNRRAVLVNVNGRIIAGSMNGMPHGTASITNNNFGGHFCIHFKNSKTHAGNKADASHQAAVKKAAGL